MSIIINKRLQKLLQKEGSPFQFDATKHTGCSDALFTLKTYLQTCREHTLDSYCLFLDAVKAFDSIDYRIIELSLKTIWCPRQADLSGLIKKLYSQFAIVLKIGKEQSKIKVGCGVRQGW